MKDFEARKRLLRERNSQKHSVPKQLASLGRDLSQFPLLQVTFNLPARTLFYKDLSFPVRLDIIFGNSIFIANLQYIILMTIIFAVKGISKQRRAGTNREVDDDSLHQG